MTCKHLYVDESGWACKKDIDGVDTKCKGEQHNACLKYKPAHKQTNRYIVALTEKQARWLLEFLEKQEYYKGFNVPKPMTKIIVKLCNALGIEE